MKLESHGILIGLRPFGERDSVATIFTHDFGVMHGMLKGAQIAKKNKPLLGQVGAMSWNARLDSQLGTFHFESVKNLAAPLMSNPKLLSLMNSVFALIATLLPEREKYENLYNKTEKLLLDLAGTINKSDIRYQISDIYLSWEINFLSELGYALDLSSCSNCGCGDNLNYLSPRTGRAVCDNCATPYLDKIYKLPLTLDTLQKFLNRACEDHGTTLPIARKLI